MIFGKRGREPARRLKLMDESKAILFNELDAGDGSFIAEARLHLRWNGDKFRRLCLGMYEVAKEYQGCNELPRDLCQLFWYCGTFLPRWFEQREFRVAQPHVNYDQAVKLLRSLGDAWFGEGCLISDDEFRRKMADI